MPRLDTSRLILASQLLDAITQSLAGMPDSPQKRLLGAKAETYRRTIAEYRTSPLSAARSEALDELVLALHGKVLEVLRRNSLDLTPGALRVEPDEDEDTPPPSTPFARVKLKREP